MRPGDRHARADYGGRGITPSWAWWWSTSSTASAWHQRETLRQKAAEIGLLADTLVMTATPIPRSLALTIYGDLESR